MPKTIVIGLKTSKQASVFLSIGAARPFSGTETVLAENGLAVQDEACSG